MVTPSSEQNSNQNTTTGKSGNTGRKPFATVVQQWTSTVELSTTKSDQSKVLQSTDNDLKKPVSEMDQNVSLEELMMEMDEFKTPQDKFLFACKTGDDANSCELLTKLLAEYPHANLNKMSDKNNSNCSLLHLLAQRNKVRCLELLSQRMTNLDIKDSISSTPLLYAVAHNCEDAVAFLLSKGSVNINAKDIYNKFPLLLALRNKQYGMAELLTSNRGIDVHVRGTKGSTVLHTMVEEGDITSVKFMVEKCDASPQRRNNEEENVLYHSLPHIEVAQYLGHKFSKKGLGKMLTNVNTYGKNLMHKTAADGFFDSMLVILGSLALGELSTAQVNSLLNTPDRFGDTPLILAVKNGRSDVVKFLCECQEVNINDGDRDGNTALHHAASNKFQNIVATLTDYGASFKPSNKQDGNDKVSSTVNCFRSLGTVLVILLSSFALVCIFSIAAVCIGFYASNIVKSTAQLREKSFAEVMDYMHNTIREHGTIQQTAVAQIYGREEMLNVSLALRVTYSVYQANYYRSLILSSSYVKLADGRTAGVVTSGNATNQYAALYEAYTNPKIIASRTIRDIKGTSWQEAIAVPVTFNRPNPADYTYINATRKSNSTIWSSPFPKVKALSFSLMTPIRDPDTDEYLGFYGLDGTTDSLGGFLDRKANEDKSTIVVVERTTGFLIGASDTSLALFKSNNSVITRFDGTEGHNRRIEKMIKYARQRYGGPNLSTIGTGRTFGTFRMNEALQAINIGRIQDDFGIDWVVMQSLPMSTFYHRFYVSLAVMFSVTAVLMVLSVAVAFLAATIFMRPIMKLIQQAEDIKLLQLEKVEKQLSGRSYFSEVKILQESFSSMTARLKQFRAFIPSHILTVIEAEVKGEENRKLENNIEHKDASSSSQSDGRGTSVVSSYNTKGMINRALKSKLSSGSVTIMTLRFSDLAEILELYSADDISETTKDLVEATRECMGEFNGQLVSMSSRKVVIAFNALIPQSDHRVRACKLALACCERVQKLKEQWTQKNLPILKIRVGVCSGTVYYGNIGTDSAKFFTIIGASVKLSDRLSNFNNQWGTEIIISDDVYEASKEEYHARPIDRYDDVLMYELGEPKSQEEWVSELNNHESSNHKWRVYAEGYELFQREMYPEALAKFTSYLEKYPFDFMSQRMVELCHENLSTLSTRTETDLATS